MRPPLAVGIVLALVAWSPVVRAEQHAYTVDDASGTGIELRGVMDYPGKPVPVGGLFELVIDASQSGLAPTSTTIAAPELTGCEVVASTPSTNGNDVATLRVQVRMTNQTCSWHGSVMAVQAGLQPNTLRFDYSGSVVATVLERDVDRLEEASRFAFLIWLAYFVLTRFIRGSYAVYLRVLADAVAMGLLALPIQADQFELLATAIALVLVVDLVIVLERPNGAI